MSLRHSSTPSRRTIRLQGYDYRQNGAYFVTICTYQQGRLFGFICEGKMVVNELGLIVTECWLEISQVRPHIELDAFVVMPNHLHGILSIFDQDTADDSAQLKGTADSSDSRRMSASLGVIIGQFKRAVTIMSKTLAQPPDQPLWQRSFYEHIIRNERSLDDIRTYIVENPAKWREDSLFMD